MVSSTFEQKRKKMGINTYTYNENILVESEADSIIDFTEDNPFGDF